MMENALKKFWSVAAAIMALSLMFAGPMTAQVNITTKKMKIADFETRTTKVVLGGTDMFNLSFKNEISRRWRVSPYEFITLDEYESVKNNPNYYFLMPMDSRLQKEAEPGITVLSLFKGGSDDPKDAKARIEIISFPLCSSESPSGRELTFLPAIIDIIQEYATDAVRSDMVGYAGLDSFPVKLNKAAGKTIHFSRTDLDGADISDGKWEEKGISIVSDDEADEIFASEQPGALVSYVVAPTTPEKNSVCYKMLISADTHEIFFLKKHKVGPGCRIGFQENDLSLISKLKKK